MTRYASLTATFGFAAGVGVRGVEAAAKFALYALAARTLGAAGAGLFFLALSLIHLGATASRLGCDRAMTRHIAAELAVGDDARARRAALAGTATMLAASAALGILVALASGTIATLWFRDSTLAPILVVVAASLPIANAAYAAGSLLMGLDRGAAAQIVQNAGVPVVTLAALIALRPDPRGLLIAYAAAYATCALAGGVLVAIAWARRPRVAAADHAPLPKLWTTARPLYALELGQAFLLSLPVLALGRFSGPGAVAVFGIASRLSMLTSTIVLSIAQVSASAFARHYRRGEWSALAAAYRRSWRTTVLICLPVLAIVTLAADPLLRLLGTDRPDARWVLWILVGGQLAYVLAAGKDMLLVMAGFGTVMRRLMLVQLAVCLLLALTLIPALDTVGAGLTGLVQWMIYSVGSALATRTRIPELRA